MDLLRLEGPGGVPQFMPKRSGWDLQIPGSCGWYLDLLTCKGILHGTVSGD